mmetsp:Transcript_153/g.266  ORF Transcript_153/g.266 Transcript_153/m.266 type:complete len:269 (+) Transcript_153:100-906(+)|eukprot:CAMPEP_0168732778 /NCGR_PEP_ID=MMETSP0724-20121128/7942_1 /TAXON_ID=265536 /ORGANISM="Amphiprora sp., Strain CCMP467" /LENGTH=268 /DNA_ID=CAMNT_0008779799 /DNA_START=117 /DNA_END=923 /DNA_ORIENTATION=+
MESNAPTIIRASGDLYRTAIALNNVAVSLLLAGNHGAALKAMTDSLQLLKLVFSRASDSHSQAMAHRRYQEALSFYSRDMGNHPSTSTTTWGCEVTAIDEDDYVAMKAAGNRPQGYFPIRIRGIPQEDEPSSSVEATRQFGITLFNHGLVQLVLAQSRAAETQPERLLNGALKSLQMSQQAYSRILLQREEKADDDMSYGHDVPSLLLFTLTLNASTNVFMAQNTPHRIQEVQEAVSAVRQQIKIEEEEATDVHRTTSLFTKHMAPAA